MFLKVFFLIKSSHLNGKFKIPRNALIFINRINVKRQHTTFLAEIKGMYIFIYFNFLKNDIKFILRSITNNPLVRRILRPKAHYSDVSFFQKDI